MNTQRVSSSEKLQALRAVDTRREWNSLDETCICILCEKTFIGRRARPVRDPSGQITLRCPTPACHGTPDVWVRPGNPLLSDDVWGDWQRVLSGMPGSDSLRTAGCRMPD